MTLGAKIRTLREEKGLHQEDIGKLFSVSKSAVSLWENDLRTPDSATVAKLADYFNVSTDYLLGRVEEKRLYAKITTEIDPDNPDLEKAYQEIGVAINQLLLNGTITDKQAVMLLEDAKREIQAKIELIRTDTERRT
ncbi:MAG: helix-turn-helix transcriptional regulator [Elusimicrobia bacterium]|nr:helix-turn-helix transcriptional regulator [Elusimicrobiota bacterium]